MVATTTTTSALPQGVGTAPRATLLDPARRVVRTGIVSEDRLLLAAGAVACGVPFTAWRASQLTAARPAALEALLYDDDSALAALQVSVRAGAEAGTAFALWAAVGAPTVAALRQGGEGMRGLAASVAELRGLAAAVSLGVPLGAVAGGALAGPVVAAGVWGGAAAARFWLAAAVASASD